MVATAAVASPLRFSTREVPPPARRGALWRLRDHGLLPIEPLPGAAPSADLTKWWLPGVSVLSGRLDKVRQIAGSPTDEMLFAINAGGSSLVEGRDGSVTVHAGEAVALEPEAVFTILRDEPTRFWGLRIPRGSIPVHHAGLPRSGLRTIPAESPALTLLTRYLREAMTASVLTSAAVADAVASHLVDLVALSLDMSPPPALVGGRSSVRTARLVAIKGDIERHLTDPGLDAGVVAARQGISTRYLFGLFADTGIAFSAYVLGLRLELARRLLLQPRHAEGTITSIAFASGFGDLSYFNRTFRRAYGMTPSELRRTPDRAAT